MRGARWSASISSARCANWRASATCADRDRPPASGGRHVSGGGTMRHRLGTIAAIFVGALLWFAHGAPAVAEQSLLETVLGRGKLVVATWSTAPPLCFTDDKGQLVGFDIDIARMISKALFSDESKVEFIVVTSEGR